MDALLRVAAPIVEALHRGNCQHIRVIVSGGGAHRCRDDLLAAGVAQVLPEDISLGRVARGTDDAGAASASAAAILRVISSTPRLNRLTGRSLGTHYQAGSSSNLPVNTADLPVSALATPSPSRNLRLRVVPVSSVQTRDAPGPKGALASLSESVFPQSKNSVAAGTGSALRVSQ